MCLICIGNSSGLCSVEDSDDDMKSVKKSFRWIILFLHMYSYPYQIFKHFVSLSFHYQGNGFHNGGQQFWLHVHSIYQVYQIAHIMLFWSELMRQTTIWKASKVHLGILCLYTSCIDMLSQIQYYQSTTSVCYIQRQACITINILSVLSALTDRVRMILKVLWALKVLKGEFRLVVLHIIFWIIY